MLPRQISTTGQYGPVPAGFAIEITEPYTTLLGRNNAGKSALLQLAFKGAHDEFGSDAVCFISADRSWIQGDTQPGARSLASYNQELYSRLASEPMRYQEGSYGQVGGELFRLLIHRGNFQRQLATVQGLLERLGLPSFVLSGPQTLSFEEVAPAAQGSGLRAVLPIVAALSTPELKLIAIDEPELSLEPVLQKALRGLLLEAAGSQLIVVATHSHLMPDREALESIKVVEKTGGSVGVRSIKTRDELADITFEMLGNSTQDLFFPGNFMVVEGASDQCISERCLELEGVPRGKVKVLSASGIDGAIDTLTAVWRSLTPIWTSDSPYAKRVVALLDGGGEPRVKRIQKVLGRRLFVLNASSLEEYLPESMFLKAGEDKAAVRAELAAASGDYARESAIKTRVSENIAASMAPTDLDLIPEFRDAIRKAVSLAN